jgi:hypothetical protein
MSVGQRRAPPRWLFVLLAIAGAWASGAYAGGMRHTESSALPLVSAFGFGAFALIMAWGAIGSA